jgi:DNA-binding CsgD family transcriptional regulator
MEALAERELRTLVAFAHDASRIARFEPRRFERWIVDHVAALIPADAVHIQVSRAPFHPGRFYLVGDHAEFVAFRNSSVGRQEWARLVNSHPLGRERHRHPTETEALLLSEFVSQTELHRLDVYDMFMRPFELNYCVTGRFFGLNRIYDLAVARSRIDFAPRDVLLVDVATTVLGLAVREPPQFTPQHLVTMGITPRETQVLEEVACGRSNVEIASDLNVSPGTVKKHLDNIFEKLGVRNRIEAARLWIAEAEGAQAESVATNTRTGHGDEEHQALQPRDAA